jgi:hypothetical protein
MGMWGMNSLEFQLEYKTKEVAKLKQELAELNKIIEWYKEKDRIRLLKEGSFLGKVNSGNWEINLKILKIGRHGGQCHQKYFKGIPIPTLFRNSIHLWLASSRNHYYIKWGLK